MATGVGWEVYEWLGDAVFHTKRVQSHLDTANDLMFDFLGAATAGYVLNRWRLIRLEEAAPARQVEAAESNG